MVIRAAMQCITNDPEKEKIYEKIYFFHIKEKKSKISLKEASKFQQPDLRVKVCS